MPMPCKGLERALHSVYTQAPDELPELFKRLEQHRQEIFRYILHFRDETQILFAEPCLKYAMS